LFSLAPVLGVTAVLLMTELSAGKTIDDLPLQILQGEKAQTRRNWCTGPCIGSEDKAKIMSGRG